MEFKPLWHYQTIDIGESLGDLTNITQHMKVCSNISGTAVRLRLDNRFNRGNMEISAISVRTKTKRRKSSADGTTDPTAAKTEEATPRSLGIKQYEINEEKPVFAEGERTVKLAPGEVRWTDPAAIRIEPGQELEVSIHFSKAEGLAGMCATWSIRTWQSYFAADADPDRKLRALSLFPDKHQEVGTPWAVFGISQIDVLTENSVRTIALFGDSITHMSFYSDALFRRIASEYPGKAVLVNSGICGNRLCLDHILLENEFGRGTRYGRAAKNRFEEDLYTDMKPDTVISLIGANDCCLGLENGFPEEFPTKEEFAGTYTEMIRGIREHGSKVFIGTVLPFNNPNTVSFHDREEARRREYNDWIKNQTEADGIIDFAAAAEEPGKKGVMKAGFDLGDRMHPGSSGGRLMAELVPLSEIFSEL